MEVTMIPAPWRLASSVSNLLMIVPFPSSKWLMGSSKKMKSKGWQRLRIKATLCCWPKDSFPAFSFILSAMPIASKRVRTSFLFLKLVSRFFSCMFSMAVSSGKIRSSWKRILRECLRISIHSLTLRERMLRSSKLMIPW